MRIVWTTLTILLLAVPVVVLAEEVRVTRVLYLQPDVESQEVMRLLRSDVQVRNIANYPDLNAVVVADVVDRIEQCESLLRERNALVRAVEPHEPELLGGPELLSSTNETASTTRVFRIREADSKTVLTVLRSIYGIKKVTALADEDAISATETADRLDRIEALLEELGALDFTPSP